jgi:NAD(P)-dependent dehydrogenase (short-subunit alcohol dehydrogenase family)
MSVAGKLAGKVVVVAGGTGTVGSGVVRAFIQEGKTDNDLAKD